MDATAERHNTPGAPETPESAEPIATVESVPATEAARSFGDLLNRVAYTGQRIVITRHGRPAAELVPATAPEKAAA